MSRYREAAGWEKGLREQARPDMTKRAEVVAAHTFRIQEGKFMGRVGARPIVVVSSSLGVRVVNTKHGWHLQEFGSARNVVQAPLRRGVVTAGLRFSPAPAP